MRKNVLAEAVEALDDRYICEALEFKREKITKSYLGKIMVCIGTLAAVILCIVFADGIISQTEEKVIPSLGNRTFEIIALADEEIEMKPGVIVEWKQYSPLMSSTVGLPMRFESDTEKYQEVDILVTADDAGKISKWNVSQEGIWTPKESGNELTCKLGEDVYWNVLPGSGMKEEFLVTIKFLENGKCVEKKEIQINYIEDKMIFTAMLK